MRGKRSTATRRSSSVRPVLAFLLGGLGLLAGPGLHAVAVDLLPTPRPAHWVLDTTGTLLPDDIARIDAKAEAARERSGGEVMLVLVDSTEGRPHRAYATELANRWGIGGPEGRNGVLLLLAKNDRKAEIALSKGIDGTGTTILAKAIMDSVMVPRFRSGDLRGGLLAGLDAVVDKILVPAGGVEPASGDATSLATPFAVEAESPAEPSAPAPAQPDAGLAELGRSGADHYRPSNAQRLVWLAPLGLLGFLVLLPALLVYRAIRPRICPSCKVKMVKLQESQEGPYLDAGQEKEQSIGSIAYDVWMCATCRTVELRARKSFMDGHLSCPRCHYQTLAHGTETLAYATELETGLLRTHQSCEQCGYAQSHDRVTPRLPTPRRYVDDDREGSRSSSSSRSFSSGSGSSSSTSSSSSSSRGSSSSGSSGGSGGGSSNFGGGGASGSW